MAARTWTCQRQRNKVKCGHKNPRIAQECQTCGGAKRESTRIRCKRCKKVKGKASFSRDVTRESGFFPWCMDCQNNYAKSHRFQDETAAPNGRICPVDDRVVRGAKNRHFCSSSCKEKAAGLKRKFGLTVEQYRAMVDATGGRCPICHNRPTAWHVDHDHSTGLVMGVVCSPCNVGALANTYHDPGFVMSLHRFLTNSPAAQLGIVARAVESQVQPSKLHKRWFLRQEWS